MPLLFVQGDRNRHSTKLKRKQSLIARTKNEHSEVRGVTPALTTDILLPSNLKQSRSFLQNPPQQQENHINFPVVILLRGREYRDARDPIRTK